MSDVRVERGTTAKLESVDGELKVASNARITAARGKLVTVTEGAYFEGNASGGGAYYYGVTQRGLEFLDIYLR